MELNSNGADLLGVTEARVLRVLARLDDPVSGRHLAKLAGLDSHMTVQRYLRKLEAIGLVLVRETPSARLYRANRQHLYWAPVESILAARGRLEDQLAHALEERFGTQAVAAVYGSVARGESSAESDFDLLVVVDDEVGVDARAACVAELTALIEAASGNAGHVIDVSESQLELLHDVDSPFVAELMRDARPLGDRRLPEALRVVPGRRAV